MNVWMKTAIKNLLAKSEEKVDYSRAKSEWLTTDKVEDNLELSEIGEDLPSCELCEHEDLRWQFEIRNERNGNLMMVGSTCIKQFNIRLLVSGKNYLEGELRDAMMDHLIRQKIKNSRHDEMLKAMRLLWKRDTEYRSNIVVVGKAWKEEGHISPGMAAFLLSRFGANQMEINPKNLKISIRKLEYRVQILHMEKRKLEIILPCLTNSQRRSLGI